MWRKAIMRTQYPRADTHLLFRLSACERPCGEMQAKQAPAAMRCARSPRRRESCDLNGRRREREQSSSARQQISRAEAWRNRAHQARAIEAFKPHGAVASTMAGREHRSRMPHDLAAAARIKCP